MLEATRGSLYPPERRPSRNLLLFCYKKYCVDGVEMGRGKGGGSPPPSRLQGRELPQRGSGRLSPAEDAC